MEGHLCSEQINWDAWKSASLSEERKLHFSLQQLLTVTETVKEAPGQSMTRLSIKQTELSSDFDMTWFKVLTRPHWQSVNVRTSLTWGQRVVKDDFLPSTMDSVYLTLSLDINSAASDFTGNSLASSSVLHTDRTSLFIIFNEGIIMPPYVFLPLFWDCL